MPISFSHQPNPASLRQRLSRGQGISRSSGWNDLTEPKGMMEVSAKDFEKLPDKEIRRFLKLKKYSKETCSPLDVINRAFHFDNSREIEYFKKFNDEEFRSKYIDYLLSNINENLD